MKKSLYKLLLVVPVFSLSACGYSLREVYDGNAYNNPDFTMNFYREWDDALKNNVKSEETIELDANKDYVFESYEDSNFEYCEPTKSDYKYDDSVFTSDDDKIRPFGEKKNLTIYDSTFHYGYISKLCDGDMFCDGNYELARVQIDEGGFGKTFKKEIKQYDYFALNFKSSIDYKRVKVTGGTCFTKAKIYVSFYLNQEDGLKKLTTTYVMNNIPTCPNEQHNSNAYKFFGFSLKNINIERCCGISISYDLLDCYGKINGESWDLEKIKSEGIAHSLLLYEMFLPNSTWH